MYNMCAKLVHRILLGLLMLIPGILKLFVFKPTGVSSMLAGMGFPAPMFFAWVLIVVEIVSGLAILASWKLRYMAWPPVIVMIVAILTTTDWANPQMPNILLHLVAASGYWMLATHKGRKDAGMSVMKHSK